MEKFRQSHRYTNDSYHKDGKTCDYCDKFYMKGCTIKNAMKKE